MVEEYQEVAVSSEVIQKKYQRGMTIEQIAMLYQLSPSYVEKTVEGVQVAERKKLIAPESPRIGMKPTVEKGRKFLRPKKPIDYEYVEKLLEQGLNLKQMASAIGFNYRTFIGRISEERPDLHERAAFNLIN